MTSLDIKRMVEQTLYVLTIAPGITQYTLYKILYFAERKHLAKWGISFVPVDFHAWECGPVPKILYQALHHPEGDREEDVALSQAVRLGVDDAANYLFPMREPDLDWISLSEIEVLKESVAENGHLRFGELQSKSHDMAWSATYAASPKIGILSHRDMALVEGCSVELADYISETESLKTALA